MDSSKNQLVEVWGDTVNFKSMLIAILIGSFVSVTIFLSAKYFMSSLSGDAKLLDGYAMLIGLGGCILSGIICSILFKPARTLISNIENNHQNTEKFICELIENDSNYISVNDLPSDVQNELSLLKLKQVFLDAEATVKNSRN